MQRAVGAVLVGTGLSLGVIFLVRLGGLYGLPNYPHTGQAIDVWHMQSYFLVALGVIATIVGFDDPPLGLAVLVPAALLFWKGATIDPTATVLFAFAVLALWVVRHASEAWRRRTAFALVAFGLAESLYVIQQALGYDVPFHCYRGVCAGPAGSQAVQTIGTIGTVGSVGALLAITAPLAPIGILPIIVFAIALTHSRAALLAAAVGLLIRYRDRKWLPLVLAPAAIAGFAWAQIARGAFSAGLSAGARVQVWAFGLSDAAATNPLHGFGLGGWAQRMYGFAPTREVFGQAHNDYAQWIAETGLIGLVLLVWWLARHRQMFVHPVFGGSVTALAIDAGAWFPFHVVPLALAAILVIGLALPPLPHTPTGA